MKISEDLEKNGKKPRIVVTTKELYDKSFIKPIVRNFDYAKEQMDDLEHFEENLNSNPTNSQHLKKFISTAKKVRENLTNKYQGDFIDPGVTVVTDDEKPAANDLIRRGHGTFIEQDI